jgi:hypothetical protein
MGDEVLEGYAAKLQLVFDHLAENEMLDEERFYTLLVESSVTPDPLPANSFVRIFNAGARGKALLTFDEFCECIERVSAKAFQADGLSETEAMVRLLQCISRSRTVRGLFANSTFLFPEHSVTDPIGNDREEEEEGEEETGKVVEEEDGEEDEMDDDSGGAIEGLDSEQTEILLRALFEHYSTDDNTDQMSAGKFYKMVRECGLLDALVTQEKVGSLYKQVMKTGKGGATFIEYPDYIEALARLAQIKFDNSDGPIELFNRLVNLELLHQVPTQVRDQVFATDTLCTPPDDPYFQPPAPTNGSDGPNGSVNGPTGSGSAVDDQTPAAQQVEGGGGGAGGDGTLVTTGEQRGGVVGKSGQPRENMDTGGVDDILGRLANPSTLNPQPSSLGCM